MSMNHWDRVRATVRGERTDRPPVCLWRHWPEDDGTPETLANAIITWQREYDCDLVKHVPAGSYVVDDWGGRTIYLPEKDPGLGVGAMIQRAVTSTDGWSGLEVLDVTAGHLGEQLVALRLVAEGLRESVPILQTVFSPLNVARKLGGELASYDLRHNPVQFKRGLGIIAEAMADFARQSLRVGAHGIIFSSPCNQRLYSEDEYREFGAPFDRMILDAVRPEAEFIVLFVSGPEDMSGVVLDYPADAINWGRRESGPTLREMQERFPGAIWGGIDERGALRLGPPAEIQAQIADSIEQAGGRLVVSTESAPFIDTPPTHFAAAREAVELRGPDDRGKVV